MQDNKYIGFTTNHCSYSNRLQVVQLNNNTISKFYKKIANYSVQDIEYKPFLRFYIASCLQEITANTLGNYLLTTIKKRSYGAVLIKYEATNNLALNNVDTIDFNIMLSSALSHLIGVPNFDAMSGKFYARFSVTNTDDSDSYLRQAYRKMELHNDGTYVEETTDWVLMQKIIEKNVEGGDSLLLHIDDWQDLAKFYNHSLAKTPIQWGAPVSKNIKYKTYHPVFINDKNTQAEISFIDQFAEPKNIEQGLYLHAISNSLESDKNIINVELPAGSILIINNYNWLHGRDKFSANKNLHRELLRQRGVFRS